MRCVVRPLRSMIATVLMVGCVSALGQALNAQPLHVFAAASLKTALDEVVEAFGYTQDVSVSYGSSAVLARQIVQGAPAGVYISANEAWMDYLEDAGRIDPQSRADILTNTLVLVSARHSQTLETWDKLPARLVNGRLAMAQYNAVPAGIYAKEALEGLGLWVQTEPFVVQADNVRAALAFAATGAVDYAIVYESDALADPRVQVIATFPPETHSEIRYPAAIVKTENSAQAAAFLKFLSTTEASAIFQKNGFDVLQEQK